MYSLTFILPLACCRNLKCLIMVESTLQCPICLETLRHPVMPPCQHAFCYSCISRYIRKCEAKCPLCREAFDEGDLRRCLQVEQLLSSEGNVSSKCD
ncbi:unnamed protein product [Hydatigera taeniaeformis]|uniref:RING-type domain-containing protein n=1 Tax=Hydatigena taeniaeformis TaxID=6205 RepID=A0A0R3WNC1_HYDTA|nr:unnamed protein product [Hydatigera taeniaeformis]